MKHLTLLTLLFVSFILVGCGSKSAMPTTNPIDDTNKPAPTEDVAPTDGDEVNEDDDTDTANQDDDNTANEDENTAESGKLAAEGYATYNETLVQDALNKGMKVALFFHASRCPNCIALNGNIETNYAQIPADTMIFKVDYDTSDALKEKYGVTTQTTLVYIDKDMNEVNKVNSPINLDEVLAGFDN